ncbi:MAG: HlyD family secretion protein [Polyangia bacterium]
MAAPARTEVIETPKPLVAVPVEVPSASIEVTEPPKGRRNRILALVVAAAAVAGSLVWVFEHGRESTDDAQVDSDVVSVPARLGGIINKVEFVENQRVTAGQELATIDDAVAKAKLAQAEAALLQAIANADAADANASLAERSAVGNKSASRANLAGSVVGEKTSAEQLNEGQAQLASADAQLTQAKQDAERARTLAQSNAVSKAQLDQTETQLRLADSNVALAKARIETLKSSVIAAHSRVDEASARAAQNSDVSSSVKQARAQADAARAQVKVSIALRDLAALDLSYTKILAPMAGVVSKKSVNVGQGVAAGQSIVALVPDQMWITANFKETQIGDMRVGQPVKIEIDAFSGKKLEGHIESLSGGTGSRFTLLPPDNASGNFTKVVQRLPVRVKIDHIPDGLPLRTGLNAVVTVDTRVQPTSK